MKKMNFLEKLYSEGKIGFVEPNEEIAESYNLKSESNLDSSKILLANDKLEEAVSLSYYSMYNILTSLFYKVGIKCENHTASIILLKKLFEVDNKDISYSKKERIDKQYYTDFKITMQEVSAAIILAEEFNKKLIDFVSKLTNETISQYREKLKEMLMDKIKSKKLKSI